MDDPVSKYRRLRLQQVQGRLIGNNFGAMAVETADGAGRLVIEEALPADVYFSRANAITEEGHLVA